jgi:hypothetical protein
MKVSAKAAVVTDSGIGSAIFAWYADEALTVVGADKDLCERPPPNPEPTLSVCCDGVRVPEKISTSSGTDLRGQCRLGEPIRQGQASALRYFH